jgi:pyruvate dehydrogenase E2 component (dihydrolipoamide acetyltransferase)
LIEVVAQEGDTLAIGEVIARIGGPGEAGGDGKPAQAEESPAEEGGEQADAETPEPAVRKGAPSGNGRRVKVSPVARRMAQTKYPGRDSNPHGREGPMAFEVGPDD